MARPEARIFTEIWRNQEWRALSLEAQWLFEAILSQPDLSKCGVLDWTPKRFAKLTANGTVKRVQTAKEELVAKRFLLEDTDTEELMVRTFFKHDALLNQPNLIVGMAHDFCDVHSEPLRDAIHYGLGVGFLDGLTQRFPKAFGEGKLDRLPEPFLVSHRGWSLACAQGRAGAQAPARVLQAPSSSTPTDNSSSSRLNVGETESEEDEPSTAIDPTPIVDAAVREAAQRRLNRQPTGTIGNPEGWLTATAAKMRATHSGVLVSRAIDGSSVEALADFLEPPPTRSTPYRFDERPPAVWDLDEAGVAVPTS